MYPPIDSPPFPGDTQSDSQQFDPQSLQEPALDEAQLNQDPFSNPYQPYSEVAEYDDIWDSNLTNLAANPVDGGVPDFPALGTYIPTVDGSVRPYNLLPEGAPLQLTETAQLALDLSADDGNMSWLDPRFSQPLDPALFENDVPHLPPGSLAQIEIGEAPGASPVQPSGQAPQSGGGRIKETDPAVLKQRQATKNARDKAWRARKKLELEQIRNEKHPTQEQLDKAAHQEQLRLNRNARVRRRRADLKRANQAAENGQVSAEVPQQPLPPFFPPSAYPSNGPFQSQFNVQPPLQSSPFQSQYNMRPPLQFVSDPLVQQYADQTARQQPRVPNQILQRREAVAEPLWNLSAQFRQAREAYEAEEARQSAQASQAQTEDPVSNDNEGSTKSDSSPDAAALEPEDDDDWLPGRTRRT